MTNASMSAQSVESLAGQAITAELESLSALKPTERLLIERTLLQLYPRLKQYNLIPWKWMNGPLIPDFIVRHTDPRLRRIVEIGCGDGLLTNILSLLFPNIEIIGIDPDRSNIAAARATIGYRQNLKFICANASILVEIPCDRIIYNHCLSQTGSTFAFKKLVFKTSRWLVDEGDFIIKESPLALMQNFALLKELFPLWNSPKNFSLAMRAMLSDVGYPNPLIGESPGIFGIPSEIFCQASRGLMLSNLGGTGGRRKVAEWEDWGEQSADSLLGFLFGNRQSDFTKELL